MNTKKIGMIIIAIILVVFVYLYFISDGFTQPIDYDDPADLSGTWDSQLVIIDTDGNTHVVNSNIETQKMVWEGITVSDFCHYLRINPTNIDTQPGQFDTITVDMGLDTYTSEYSVIEQSTGTYHVDHALLGFKEGTQSSNDVDGEYEFLVDSGPQIVGNQRRTAGSIQLLLEYLGGNYGTYTIEFYISGNFQYYPDDTLDWQGIELPLTTTSITVNWQADTLSVVNINWDTTYSVN